VLQQVDIVIEQQAHPSQVLYLDGWSRAAPSLVVGIGAAAGGSEALRDLFIALDESAGLTFVVLQHANAQHAGQIVDALQALTDLTVKELRANDEIERDHVFVAPPGFAVELNAKTFMLSRPSEPGARRKPVNRLFRSIANSFGARSVGIVLSGEGTDGTIGVQMIARAGGLTLAHDPARAHVASMPRSAIASGAIDHVLSPFAMAEALLLRAAQSAKPTEPARTEIVRGLDAENRELKRLNQDLLSIHGKLHGSIQHLRASLEELQVRYDGLTSAHRNLSNLLANSALAIIVLDREQRVRGFTPDVTHIYDVQLADLGKLLTEIAHRAHDMPALPELNDLRAAPNAPEVDVVTRDRWYLRRTLPHLSRDGAVDGMLVAFIDVTKLKSSEAAAYPHEEWLRSITDAMPTIISFVDDALHGY
jgi:PAS domain-containing protein